jgi:2,4-dienoyl-CoA reductase-like NADH-dependent reductase (Old Yellow Enzyme family)
LGIHQDTMVPGLKELVGAVHQHGGRIVFQLGHAGLQTTRETIGQIPLGPSSDSPMDDEAIQEVIASFILAGRRAAEAGADGVQLHAAHGYLINQFLSPFYNHRQDPWGGSVGNRFRILKVIIEGIKKFLPENMILMVKLNAQDYTPQEGITPPLAVEYAGRLEELGIDGLEVSCGTSLLSPWNMCRGEVPVNEMLLRYSEPKRSKIETILKNQAGKYNLVEGYNLEAAKMIRPVIGNIPLLSVGGWRTISRMEETITYGYADFISMCRPFIREPSLVRRIKSGKTDRVSCISCNKCLAALANNMPVQCYVNGFNAHNTT